MSIARFRQLHEGDCFVMPNPWDAGSAKILHAVGFEALATTSAGHAHTLGRKDAERAVGRGEALDHAADIVAATPLPVNGDLERGYGDKPDEVAATVRLAIGAGLAGCSIEDATGDPANPIYDRALATDRIAAAVEACGDSGFVLTARAENLLHGIEDIDDTIERLQGFAAAGAECVYAPGIRSIEVVRQVAGSVGCWVNVLAAPYFTTAELAEAGVSRISIGSGLSRAAYGALIAAADEIQKEGTFNFAAQAPGSSDIETMLTNP